jgi:phosphoribosylformylglycinamidine synthase
MPDYEGLCIEWEKYEQLLKSGKILSAQVYENAMTAPNIVNMALGNLIGFIYSDDKQTADLKWGSIIFEASEPIAGYKLLGETHARPEIVFGNFIMPLAKLLEEWHTPLSGVFPVENDCEITESNTPIVESVANITAGVKVKAIIPVFPGTSGEYDAANALARAGAEPLTVPIRNLSPSSLDESIEQLKGCIADCQILVLPAGLDSVGGMVALFSNVRLYEQLKRFVEGGGLLLGINDGFKALVRLGLLGVTGTFTAEFGGRHCHKYLPIAVQDVDVVKSPWLTGSIKSGEIYVQPISHSHGLFTGEVPHEQIAFKFADSGRIEGVCSPCGRVLGKIAHFERYSADTAKNICGNKFLPLFENAVRYFQ